MKIIVISVLVLVASFVTSAIAADVPDFSGQLDFIHPSHGAARTAQRSGIAAFDVAQYHNGSTLYCSQCHVMHASEAHAPVTSVPDPFGAYPRNFTPTDKLLKATDPVMLCLTCHDNQSGIPDVVGADVNGLTSRSAGFFATVGTDNINGHKLELGVQPEKGGWELCVRCHFYGEFATAAVTCIDCHNPHGNGRARNLQWASDPGGEPDLGYYIRPGSTGLTRYETDNIGFPSPTGDEFRELSNICKDCHHGIQGKMYVDQDGDGIHEKHPAYDSEAGADGINTISQGDVKGSTVSSHWVDGTGGGFTSTARVRYLSRSATDFSSSRTVAANNGVFCLSCHKAHGSDRPFSLAWDPSQAGEGCDQCHWKTGI